MFAWTFFSLAAATFHQELVRDLEDKQTIVARVEVILLDAKEISECLNDYHDFLEDFQVEEGPLIVNYHFVKRDSFTPVWWNRALLSNDTHAELLRLPWKDHVFIQVAKVEDDGPCTSAWSNSSPITAPPLRRNCPYPQSFFHKRFMDR